MHDFRIVPGKRVTKLIFGVVVPENFTEDEALVQRITEFANTLNPRHQCVIGIDRNYFTDHTEET